MFKRFLLVVTMLLAACGTESGSKPPTDGGGTNPPGLPDGTGSLPVAFIAQGNIGKVVVRRNDLVWTQVAGFEEPPTQCTVDNDCTVAGVGGVCHVFPDGGWCAVEVRQEVFKYIMQVAAGDTSITIPYGINYTVEVIEATPGAPAANPPTPNLIIANGYQMSNLFDFSSAGVAVHAPATTLWPTPAPVVAPTITFPAIYIGMPAPYNTYTVQPHVSYPWAAGNWSLATCGGSAPVVNTKATFPAPAAGTTSVSCVGTFYLAGSLLLTTETEKSWAWSNPIVDPVAPVGTGTVPLPP